MSQRDPLSVNYDGVVHQIVLRAIYAQRSKRGVQAWVASPRGEYRATDRGGRTKHERAFTRSAYYLVFRTPLNNGVPPAWSLKLTWGDDAQRKPSSSGKLARPVTVRVWPRSQARVRGPRWSQGEGRSEVGRRIDDLAGTVLAMIRQRIAAIAAATVAVGAIAGIGIAYASSTVNVPNANGQLTGPVSICVNTANEGQQYVELHHPAPGNCAAGYLQYQANQVAPASTSAPAEVTNSETFGATATTSWQLGLPPGSHVDSIASVKFLPAASTEPAITVAVSTLDNANGQFKLTFTGGAPVVADEVEITYNYSL